MTTVLTDAQREQLLIEWNQTTTSYPRDYCIHQLFETQVEETPHAKAIVFKDQQMTYQHLNQRANQLAHYLRRLRVGPEVLVGIYVERSLEMIVGLLGILKAGGAYVPLDPTYPQERLAFNLEDTQLSVILTQVKWRLRVDELVTSRYLTVKPVVICLDNKDRDFLTTESQENLTNETTPENLAYVMYTSGSTGTPKGVCVVHRGVVRLVKNTNYLHFSVEEIVLQLASLSFDASTLEIWGPLLNGAQLVIMPPQIPSLEELGNALRHYQITTLWLTAGLFHLMVDQRLADLSTVRQLLAGGDVLSVPHVQTVLKTLKAGGRLINGYGPTENTTFTCCYVMTELSQVGDSVSIGRPIANTQVYVLDEQLQPVPVATVGELYIGGDGLARGYLNQPALTAAKFIPHPFSQDPQARLYQSGDLVRYQSDGNLEFLGRIDQQVKIRGFRVELGEIEAVLKLEPTVRDAIVIAQEETPGNKRLVAYIISNLIPERLPFKSSCLALFDQGSPLALTTEDISCDGVCLTGVPPTCYVEQPLRLRLHLPRIADDVWVTGNIVWCQGERAGVELVSTGKELRPLCQTIEHLFETQGFIKVIQRTSAAQLRNFLTAQLPAYMIPSSFIFLSSLPLTPNGKVDRQALSSLSGLADSSPLEKFQAPNTPKEELVAKIWAEVLQLSAVGIHDQFIELGGHSLLAIQIISRVREVFQVDLPLHSLFEWPTVAQLANRIESLWEDTVHLAVSPIPIDHRPPEIPLSFSQQQLWLSAQLTPHVPVYNEPFTIRFGSAIAVTVLEQSINEILRRHEALRTIFPSINGQPCQVIIPFTTYRLPVVELTQLPTPAEREAEALRLATTEAKQPFDLAHYPLFRLTLIKLGENDYRLFATFHHIIFDGVSLYSVFLKELEILYRAGLKQQPSPLTPLPLQYVDFALWQRQWLGADVLATELAYWKSQLAGFSPWSLPTDKPRLPYSTARGARYCLALSKDLTEALKALSRREGVTLFMTLLSTFKTLCYRYTGQGDITVGTVSAGRHRTDLEQIMGYFLNILVLRTDLSDNPPFRQLLGRVRTVTSGAYAHQHLPFEQLVTAFSPMRSLDRQPLFQVAFILETPLPTSELGWQLSQLDLHTGTTKFDLTMELDERETEGIIGRIEYNTDLFEEATIARMVGHFETLLEGIVIRPNQRLSELPLLTLQEQQQLWEWGGT